MPMIAYRKQRFNGKARKTVEQAKLIIDDLSEQGYTLTLRQLYYQMVSKNFIANETQAYKRLGRIICDAREMGEIDWYAIEDRGRGCYLPGHTATPEEVLKGIERQLRLNPWLDQDVYLVVGVEKAALEGVIERPASRWRAPYMSCKGYLSASEAWRTGRRYEAAIADGKRPVFLHLGDHDPSGLHMTDDNRQRMSLFAREGRFNDKFELVSGGIEVNRLALHMDQVEEYGLPENPAKDTDSRFAGYRDKYETDSSWELDALSPKVIDNLIHEAIKSYVDQERWEKTLALEADRRQGLRLLGMRWAEVEAMVLSEDLKPHERMKVMDAILDELPDVLLTFGHRLPKVAEQAALAMRTEAGKVVNRLTAVVPDELKDTKELKGLEEVFSKGFEEAQVAGITGIVSLEPESLGPQDADLVHKADELHDRVISAQELRGTFEMPELLKPDRSPFEGPAEAEDDDEDAYEPEEPLPEGFEEDDGDVG